MTAPLGEGGRGRRGKTKEEKEREVREGERGGRGRSRGERMDGTKLWIACARACVYVCV